MPDRTPAPAYRVCRRCGGDTYQLPAQNDADWLHAANQSEACPTDPASWAHTQLLRQQPPSEAWLVEFLVNNFGYNSSSATALVRDVREDVRSTSERQR